MARKHPSKADVELFRRSVGGVRPLDSEAQEPIARSVPKPNRAAPQPPGVRRDVRAETPSYAYAEAGERLSYLREGLQHRVLKKLRRGQFAIDGELHLRGLTASEALRATADFLEEAVSDRLRCVRVVHGKGHGSADGRPVIKGELDYWLRRQAVVDAFCSARDVDGGSGALYVLLRD